MVMLMPHAVPHALAHASTSHTLAANPFILCQDTIAIGIHLAEHFLSVGRKLFFGNLSIMVGVY